jgi:SAM-dependent methyltransferase
MSRASGRAANSRGEVEEAGGTAAEAAAGGTAAEAAAGGTAAEAATSAELMAVELARRGLSVVGVEVDAGMLDTAREKAPQITWVLADLAAGPAPGGPFDLVVAAGNVMIFLQLGTEAAVVENLAAVLRPRGLLVAGFQLGRQLPLARYDQLCTAAGLSPLARYATWDRQPHRGGDYAVSVHQRLG